MPLSCPLLESVRPTGSVEPESRENVPGEQHQLNQVEYGWFTVAFHNTRSLVICGSPTGAPDEI